MHESHLWNTGAPTATDNWQQWKWACDPASPAGEAPKSLASYPFPAVTEHMNPATQDVAHELSFSSPTSPTVSEPVTWDILDTAEARTIPVPQAGTPLTPAAARQQQPWRHSDDIKRTEQQF